MIKRLFDAVFSALALLITFPLLIGIAVWVKFDAPGPVFFRQIRVGLREKEFRIYKYRTMYVNTEASGLQITVGADHRITRSGAFLRKYKLDELPQFLNVLFGDMSIVGPRPEVPRYVNMYPLDIKCIVLSVKPGITDKASIYFRSENDLLAKTATPEQAYIEEILPRKLSINQEYVVSRTFLGDLAIILRTVVVIFHSH